MMMNGMGPDKSECKINDVEVEDCKIKKDLIKEVRDYL